MAKEVANIAWANRYYGHVLHSFTPIKWKKCMAIRKINKKKKKIQHIFLVCHIQ